MNFLFQDLKHSLRTWLSDASGATAIEYGLIAAGIGIVIIGAVFALGGNLSTLFNNVSNNL